MSRLLLLAHPSVPRPTVIPLAASAGTGLPLLQSHVADRIMGNLTSNLSRRSMSLLLRCTQWAAISVFAKKLLSARYSRCLLYSSFICATSLCCFERCMTRGASCFFAMEKSLFEAPASKCCKGMESWTATVTRGRPFHLSIRFSVYSNPFQAGRNMERENYKGLSFINSPSCSTHLQLRDSISKRYMSQNVACARHYHLYTRKHRAYRPFHGQVFAPCRKIWSFSQLIRWRSRQAPWNRSI